MFNALIIGNAFNHQMWQSITINLISRWIQRGNDPKNVSVIQIQGFHSGMLIRYAEKWIFMWISFFKTWQRWVLHSLVQSPQHILHCFMIRCIFWSLPKITTKNVPMLLLTPNISLERVTWQLDHSVFLCIYLCSFILLLPMFDIDLWKFSLMG